MATNLVSQIMDFLTPDIISKIAGYFGLDRYSTQKAIGASVPAMLAGLVGLASKPEGAKQLSNVLSQQPSGALDNMRSLTERHRSNGRSLRTAPACCRRCSAEACSTTSRALSASSPASAKERANRLLGMLAPLVLGTVAQQQRQSGLDANGLSSFLASQKDNIASAMPSGFANMLSGTGITRFARRCVAQQSAAASAAAGRFAQQRGTKRPPMCAGPPNTRRATRSSAASSGWLPWALGLLVLAGLAWWLTSQPGQRVVEQRGHDGFAEPHRRRGEHIRPDHLGDQQHEIRAPGDQRHNVGSGRLAEASAGRGAAR